MDKLGVSKTSVVENLLVNGLGSQMRSPPVINESVEQEDNPNSDSNSDDDSSSLTNGEQEIFDIAWEGGEEMGVQKGIQKGRGELMTELRRLDNNNRSNPNISEESHQHEMKPWLQECEINGCHKANPDFVEDSTPESELSCETLGCGEELGKAKDVVKIKDGKCPACGESLFSKIKGVFSRKDSDSEDDSE